MPAKTLPYVIGIDGDLSGLHAVNGERDGVTRDGRHPRAECGAYATIAQEWGEFRRGNERLTVHRVCPRCAWTVALANGTVEEELAAVTPTAAELLAWQRLLPDPGLFVRVCRAILAARQAEDEYEADHPRWAQLLGHLTAHRPETLFPEDCPERSCEHDDEDDCHAETKTIACRSCSVLAESWAGEWEGQYDVTVPAPCAVLAAMAEAFPASNAD